MARISRRTRMHRWHLDVLDATINFHTSFQTQRNQERQPKRIELDVNLDLTDYSNDHR